ncbi:hypothetical protein WMF27_10425 [Sorangium sp. So ce281]|uniref:hypothetical protein n=1 Tax=unclassified Sorangium TaxID=2621164 RepID=UPI003F646B48
MESISTRTRAPRAAARSSVSSTGRSERYVVATRSSSPASAPSNRSARRARIASCSTSAHVSSPAAVSAPGGGRGTRRPPAYPGTGASVGVGEAPSVPRSSGPSAARAASDTSAWSAARPSSPIACGMVGGGLI